MATRKIRKFGEGGSTSEADAKARGLELSKDDKVGFLERLRMGNIDEEGSEAYNRFGAGRGKAARPPVEMAKPAPQAATPVAMPAVSPAMRTNAEAQGKRQPSGDASVAEDYSGPRTKSIEVSPAKAPAKAAPAKAPAKAAPAKAAPAKAAPAKAAPAKTAAKAETRDYSNEGRSTPTAKASKTPGNYGVEDIPLDAPRTPVKGEKVDSTELGRNISNALNATPGIQAVGRLASAGKAAQKATGSRALSTAVDDGVTYLGKSGRRQVGGFDEVGTKAAKELANNPTKRLPAPPKQIGGPSKKSLVERDRAARAAARKESMNEENAARHGLNRKDPDFAEKAGKVRKDLGGDDWTLGMKKGGAVKGWGIARGARKAQMR
jgi:hypothetical protein